MNEASRPQERVHWYQRLRPRPQRGWIRGNRIELLENGEQYFPAVVEAVAAARYEVLIESFILFEDQVGLALKAALVAAARRGVEIDVLIDDYGSPEFSPEFVSELVHAGVRLRVFDPAPRLFGRFRTNLFRRMHRKIVVVDGDVAFVGGINFSADHLADFGPEAKQDFALRIRGPLVAEIQTFARSQLKKDRAVRRRPVVPPPSAGRGEAMFVVRDNARHRNDIERQYRAAIRTARHEVIIANAYFFPGYRLLHALRHAARRGVKVRLILQGQPDMKFVKVAAGLLHGHLLPAGVEIHEYCRRPLHAKVAVIDHTWATVGSSNLDPLSLALNLEANVITRDPVLIEQLRARLERLMADDCEPADVGQLKRRGWWHSLLSTLAYHVARWFPSWVGWMPAHRPVMQPLHAKPPVPPPATPEQERQPEHAG